MPVGFYELLQVAPDAAPEAIRAAYQERVAEVVRKARAAEARHQDLAGIEARRLSLAEAWAVLSDPSRRRRYDRFRELSRVGLPADPEELWREASRSLVDPAAAAALEVVRAVTDLRVGEPVGAPPAEPELEVSPVQVREVPAPTPVVDPPTHPVTPPRRMVENRPPPSPDLPIDRTVSGESLARLFEQYGPSGACLAALRDLRRVSLDELSASTRVTRRFLDAMERDAYTELPGATFVRGYVKMVLRALEALDGAEADEFVEGYMSRYHRARG